MDQVDVTRMMLYVNELSGEQSTLIGGEPYLIETRSSHASEELGKATQYAYEHFERLGLDVRYHNWKHNGDTYPPNVVAEKPGLTNPDDIVIIGAHLDSTAGGQTGYEAVAPGADDNASGSVAVLMAAEVLSPYTFDATIRFVLFTGEEQGLWGSTAYATSVSSENILDVINLDMIAWDSKDGPDMDIHARSTVPGCMDLANVFSDTIAAYTLDLLPVIYESGTTASDHSSFWNQGFPAILAIENYRVDSPTPRDFNAYYHSTSDLASQFNQDFYGQMTKAALGAVAHLAGLRTDCHLTDLDCNCQVDVQDVTTLAGRWGADRGQWQYHLVYDYNTDDAVSVADLQILVDDWGWTCTQPGRVR